jgi:hypothetical protein
VKEEEKVEKMSPTSILRLAARQCAHPQRLHAPKRLIAAPARLLSHSAIRAYPRKDSQDKDSINTEATEYSKSGSDDAAARQEKAAFDPSTTDPQEEKEIAGAGNEVCDAFDRW